MTNGVLLSVVIPAWNEAGVIGSVLDRLSAVAASTPKLAGRVEVIVVSDGSADGTFDEAVAHLGDHGRVLQLVKNAGSHVAIRCGLEYASGEYVAILSADGQDPPELLPDMIEAFGSDVSVVWGRRIARAHDSRISRFAAGIYYRLFRRLTGLNIPPSGIDFAVMRRTVVDAVLQHRERNTSLFLLIFNLGFPEAYVDYERGERAGGESRWTFRARAKLATDMLTTFSAAPIRLLSLAGTLIGLFGLLVGGVALVRGLLGQVPVSGWSSLMVVTSVMSGLMLIALGFLGEYVWRTLDEVRARPRFLVGRETVVGPDKHE